jgi:sn-glycerol 3-phosphate transport system ATP-binding protein
MSLLPMSDLPASLRPSGSTGPGPFLVGVRPEHLVLGPETPEHLAARVESHEFLGAETLVYLDCHGTGMIARVPGNAKFSDRRAVGVSWRDEDAHVFEEASGRRVDVAGMEVDRRAASL